MCNLRENSGFTIVELLAAMVISSLVLAFVFSMYLFIERVMGEWQRRTELLSLVDQTAQRIATDVTECSAVYESSDSLLTLEKNQLDTIHYRFINGNISRNGISFSATSVRGSQYALNALVTFSVDTSTSSDQAFRLWYVRVIGQSGSFRDSSIVHLATLMSSEELVRKNRLIAQN